jgi:hypothetical protein
LYRYDAAGAFSISDPLMSIGLYRQKGTQQLQANGVITGSLKYSSDDGGKIPGALEIFGVGKISTEEREAVLAVRAVYSSTFVNVDATARVGLYMLNPVDPQRESAWFRPFEPEMVISWLKKLLPNQLVHVHLGFAQRQRVQRKHGCHPQGYGDCSLFRGGGRRRAEHRRRRPPLPAR